MPILSGKERRTAVTTPWSHELCKDILGVVAEELIPVVCHQLEDGLVLASRNGSALDRRLESTSDPLVSPCLDGSGVNDGRSSQRELCLSGQVLNDESRPLVTGKVE